MLVYNKVVHINRTINNVIKYKNSPWFLNLLTRKCICGTAVTAHVVENKHRRAWQKNYCLLFRRLLEYLSLLFKIISGTLVIYDILPLLELSDYLQTCFIIFKPEFRPKPELQWHPVIVISDFVESNYLWGYSSTWS